MKKRLISILSIIACLSLLISVQITGVTASAAGMEYTADTFSFYTEPWIQAWLDGGNEAVQTVESQYTTGLEVTYKYDTEDYSEMIEKAGAFKEFEEPAFTFEEDIVTIKKVAVCENRDITFTFEHNVVEGDISWNVEISKTMGEVLKNAGLNTVLGMGTVFVVLILISCIISLFGIFNKIGSKKPAKEEVVAAPAPVAEVVAQTSDDELIAVISAAIAAYEEEEGQPEGPVDGLVVRSIKKRGFN